MAVLATCVVALVLASYPERAASAEPFVKLSGPEIRAKLAGMEITDDIHSSEGILKRPTQGK